MQVFDAALERLIADMLETMYAAPGIGLAATQVNVHQQLIVVDVSEARNEPQVFINPVILARDGTELSEEGCLSVPQVFEPVERAARVTSAGAGRARQILRARADGAAGSLRAA